MWSTAPSPGPDLLWITMPKTTNSPDRLDRQIMQYQGGGCQDVVSRWWVSVYTIMHEGIP